MTTSFTVSARDHAAGRATKAFKCAQGAFRRLSAPANTTEVMVQVTAGPLQRQIAHHIGIAGSPVKVHRLVMMRKMKARSLPELSRMADILKLIPDGPATLLKYAEFCPVFARRDLPARRSIRRLCRRLAVLPELLTGLTDAEAYTLGYQTAEDDQHYGRTAAAEFAMLAPRNMGQALQDADRKTPDWAATFLGLRKGATK